MDRNDVGRNISFWARLSLGFRVMLSGVFAGKVKQGLEALEPKAVVAAPERVHASGLLLLSALQREGRLVDFLQQDVAGFSDDQVGAAARVVHGGCRKILRQYFDLEPAAKETEGSEITLAKDFNPQRIRLTGNVTGQPPFRGTLRHHGWIAREIRMPSLSEDLDARVIAPAEIELP